MFWENFVNLCNKNNQSPNRVCAILGLSTATATKWKNGALPRDTTLTKVADYFGVSVDYLMGNAPDEKVTPKKEAPADTFISYKSDSIENAAELLKHFEGRGIIIVADENKKPPEEENLSEGERMMLEVFRLVPDDQQKHVIEMIRTTLKMQGLLK